MNQPRYEGDPDGTHKGRASALADTAPDHEKHVRPGRKLDGEHGGVEREKVGRWSIVDFVFFKCDCAGVTFLYGVTLSQDVGASTESAHWYIE